MRRTPLTLQEWKSPGVWRLEFEFYVDNDPFRGSAPGPETDFDFVGVQVGSISPSGKQLEFRLKAKSKPLARIPDLIPTSPRVREPTFPPQPFPIPDPGGSLDRQR